MHSSYQRSIANTLTKMRTMHLLEDNSSGETLYTRERRRISSSHRLRRHVASPRCPPLFSPPPTPPTGYAVDVSIPGTKSALEADGPPHLARTDVTRMLGPTAMKKRHLEAMGWSVINITFQVQGGVSISWIVLLLQSSTRP